MSRFASHLRGERPVQQDQVSVPYFWLCLKSISSHQRDDTAVGLHPLLVLPRASRLTVGRSFNPSAPLHQCRSLYIILCIWKMQIIKHAFFHLPSILSLQLASSVGQDLAYAVPYVTGSGSSLEASSMPGMIRLHCRCFLYSCNDLCPLHK